MQKSVRMDWKEMLSVSRAQAVCCELRANTEWTDADVHGVALGKTLRFMSTRFATIKAGCPVGGGRWQIKPAHRALYGPWLRYDE